MFLDEVEKVIGRNYIGSILQLIKEFKSIDVIGLKKSIGKISIKNCNISLYPKHWKVEKLSDVTKNKQIMSVIDQS